jgi:hypothetical protein
MDQYQLTRLALEFIDPVAGALGDPAAERRLLAELGYELPEGLSLLGAGAQAVEQLVQAAIDLAALGEDTDPAVVAEQLVKVTGALRTVVQAVQGFTDSLSAAARTSPFVTGTDVLQVLPGRLVDHLMVSFVRRRTPALHRILLIAGVLEETRHDPQGAPFRVAFTERRIRWDRLPQLLSDPVGLLKQRYGWDQAQGIEADLLIRDLRALGAAFGVRAELQPVDQRAKAAFDLALGGAATIPDDPEVLVARVPLLPLPRSPLGLEVYPVANQAGQPEGVGAGVYVAPDIDLTVQLGESLRAELALEAFAAGFGVVVRRGEAPAFVSAIFGASPASVLTNVAIDVNLALVYESADGASLVLVGTPEATHLAVGSIRVAAGLAKPAGGEADVVAELTLTRGSLVVRGGDGDGFVSRMLGDGVAVDFDLGVGFSTRRGLYIVGSAMLEATIPVRKDLLGVLWLESVYLAFRADTARIEAVAAATANVKLGPIVASVDRIGISLRFEFPQDGKLGPRGPQLGFKAPTGIGLAIAAGPVHGGGYLFCDPDKGEYAGVAELSIGILSLKAVGLLNTRLPDGRPGFSLLLIITAEFPPIQLGFGFTLLGVGGLLGVQRTIAVDALRDGVRTRALEAILFPRNPVANATQLLAVLRTVFPPAEARFTFGPMVKLGWGPNQLLELEVALILELPSPLKLVVLGRIQALLPNRQAAVAQLRLDVLGVLDVDRGEVSVDAALIDSRIAAFTLSGEMALRAGWKATKGFALAVGGFHPRFAPPPGFPILQRLAIALATGDNPRIRLEAYLAITSNTVQFGARLDLWVEAGPFSASAYAALDALVQFTPFHFTVTLSMGIDIAWNGSPFLHAQLEATLEGPTPWHAFGYLEFNVLFLKARIGVDVIVGEAAAEEPARIDLADVLRAAFQAEDSLAATLPPAAPAGVSLRAIPAADGPVVHPFGGFTLRQRALPLDTTIGRYGAAMPAPNTATRFELLSVTVGTVTLTDPPAVLDDFPAAQFADLSDDERLSRPAFEAMPSGAVVAAGASRYRWVEDGQARPAATSASIAYDEAVIDDPAGPPQSSRTAVPLDATVAGLLLAGGAAARSPARERDAVAGPDQRITVVGERYVVAPLDTLPLGPDAAKGATSYTQAAERRDGGQLVTAAEVSG